MFLDIPLSDILFFAAVLTGGAVVAGFIAGLFGVGGGIVMVPILTELFGLGLRGSDPIHAQHIAVGTSLAINTVVDLRQCRRHAPSPTCPISAPSPTYEPSPTCQCDPYRTPDP